MKQTIALLLTATLLCVCLAGCTNSGTPAAGTKTDTAFSVTADDFMTQFMGLTMRTPEVVGDIDSSINQGGRVKTYTFADTLHPDITYTIALDYRLKDGILTAVSISSQLVKTAEQVAYSANPFFGVYAREAIRALDANTDFSAINENCNFAGATDADSTYQTDTLSIQTVVAGNTITASITAR